jgi:hypothetical protein
MPTVNGGVGEVSATKSALVVQDARRVLRGLAAERDEPETCPGELALGEIAESGYALDAAVGRSAPLLSPPQRPWWLPIPGLHLRPNLAEHSAPES